jgi:hypothetical protein
MARQECGYINRQEAKRLRCRVDELASLLWAMHIVGKYPVCDGWSTLGEVSSRPNFLAAPRAVRNKVYQHVSKECGAPMARLPRTMFAAALDSLSVLVARYRRNLASTSDVMSMLRAAEAAVDAMSDSEKRECLRDLH